MLLSGGSHLSRMPDLRIHHSKKFADTYILWSQWDISHISAICWSHFPQARRVGGDVLPEGAAVSERTAPDPTRTSVSEPSPSLVTRHHRLTDISFNCCCSSLPGGSPLLSPCGSTCCSWRAWTAAAWGTAIKCKFILLRKKQRSSVAHLRHTVHYVALLGTNKVLLCQTAYSFLSLGYRQVNKQSHFKHIITTNKKMLEKRTSWTSLNMSNDVTFSFSVSKLHVACHCKDTWHLVIGV